VPFTRSIRSKTFFLADAPANPMKGQSFHLQIGTECMAVKNAERELIRFSDLSGQVPTSGGVVAA
jgi:hypothetical protein